MLPWSTSTQRATKRVPVDPALLAVTLILALVGVVMVFSASAVVAGNRFHDPWYFLKRQLAWLGAGLLVMHLISKIDYTIWKKLAIPLLFGTTVLLMLVLVPSFGSVAKGRGDGCTSVRSTFSRPSWRSTRWPYTSRPT